MADALRVFGERIDSDALDHCLHRLLVLGRVIHEYERSNKFTFPSVLVSIS
jgi:hypothetical protein